MAETVLLVEDDRGPARELAPPVPHSAPAGRTGTPAPDRSRIQGEDAPMPPAILCVDDEPSMLDAYQRILGRHHRVTVADDPQAALDLLARNDAFGVVVCDLHMPGMGGDQFLARVRESHPATVRVLVTGQSNLERAMEAVNTGNVFRFLTKPCSAATIRAAVDAAMAQHLSIVSEKEESERALKASEDRYRLLFDANPFPMWVHDAEGGRFLAVNDSAVRFYGYERSTLLDLSVGAVEMPGKDAPRPADGLRLHPCVHRLANGERRQVELTSNAIEFAGRPAVLVIVNDVTERKLLESQLKQAQKLESIGQLAAGIAHEINTPIQYIGDNTAFLRDVFRGVGDALARYRRAALSPEALRDAERFAREADIEFLLEEAPKAITQTLDGVAQVARIVKAMKEFSHPSGEEKSPVDLNRALENVVAVARNEWKYVAEVGLDLAADLPPVDGLAGELNQVFLNLLVNAAHAVREGGGGGANTGVIRIRTRQVGDAVEVRIADSGCGIPADIRDRVFDPFFTTKPVGQGTGQGLAIAHAVVVQRHGGSLAFESEVGRGTTFIVRLPVRDAGPLLTPASASAAGEPARPQTGP